MRNEIKVGNIVRDKRDNRLFEVLEVFGTSGVARPLDPEDLRKNERWAFLIDNVEVMFDESTEALDILFKQPKDE